jgi:hypothetical protein
MTGEGPTRPPYLELEQFARLKALQAAALVHKDSDVSAYQVLQDAEAFTRYIIGTPSEGGS